MEVYKENGTELSKYVWKLEHNNTDYNIKWKILHHIGQESAENLHEKLEIANTDRGTSLNKRNILICSSVHFKKLYFKT